MAASPAHDVVVQVHADGYPLLERHCPTCDKARPFACTGNFRLNANGKLVDIWLLYRCEQCSFTYNLPIVERTPVRRIDRGLFEEATRNDPSLVARLARDVGLIKRNKVKLLSGDEWRLEPPAPAIGDLRGDVRLTFEFPVGLIVRLDHVLASCLGVSRSAARRLMEAGDIEQLTPGNMSTMRLWEGCEFLVHPSPAGQPYLPDPDDGGPIRRGA